MVSAIISGHQSFAAPTSETDFHLSVPNKYSLDNPTYDFGGVKTGNKVEHIFILRNLTETPVILDRVSPSCECTGAVVLDDFNGKELRILPGASAKVKITLDTSKVDVGQISGGKVDKEILVYIAGQPIHPAATLHMTGRITNGIYAEPDNIGFGSVDCAKGVVNRISVIYEPLEYDKKYRLFPTPDTNVDVVLEKQITRPIDRSIVQTYKVSISPNAVIGPISGALSLQTDDNRQPVIRVPYTGWVRGRINAEPLNVSFGMIHSASALTDSSSRTRWILLIGNAANADYNTFWKNTKLVNPLRIDADLVIQGNSTDLNTHPPLVSDVDMKKTCWLRVRITKSVNPGRLSGAILLSFPDGERMKIPVYGTIQ